ncbi:MAG TPA: DUF2243 domain-containing protein [Burkholderiales bacterium]
MRATKIRNAALLLGVGLGALLDVILFERVLHWRVPAATAPWFPVLGWAMCLAGVLVQWSALRGPGPLPSSRVFAAWLLLGWGAFNVCEGAVERSWLLAAAGAALLALAGVLFLLAPFRGPDRRSGYDRRSPLASRY